MRRNQKAITIQDVANEAGVSVTTVSRVLNDKDDVAQETYQRVQKVIDDLGYISNLAARSMRSQRKGLIGMVVPDIGFPYSIDIMKGVYQAISESKFDLLLYTSGGGYKESENSREQHYISLLNDSLTDGVIIVGSVSTDIVTGAPIIAVDPHHINPNFPSVQGTNYRGALDVMEYLLKLGHTRIGFIYGKPEIGSINKRYQGYADALGQAGYSVDDDLVVEGDLTAESGYQGTKTLMSLQSPPTAIFASNDQTAIGTYKAASELGLEIPNDLSVVGFDNIAEAEYLGLTTVDQSLSEMGYKAINILIDLINQKPLPTRIVRMPSKLIIRNSCKVLA